MRRIWLIFMFQLMIQGLFAQDIISLIIIKSEFQMIVYEGTNQIRSYPVAIGKNPGDKKKVGDWRTPEGNFYIEEIVDSTDWFHDFHDGKGPIRAYGPWFLRLYTGADVTDSGGSWTGIGIHGTHDPDSIGTRASMGCIRMKTDDLIELKEMVEIGTPVKIIASF